MKDKDNKYYYKDGTTSSEHDLTKILHRIDGPAVEFAGGDKEWHVDGKLHRIDGPAVEFANGDKLWHIDNKYFFNKEEFNLFLKEVKQLPLALRLIDPREWVRKL